MVWNAVGGILIEGVGWQATYIAFAAITLISSLPFTVFVVRDKPEDKGLAPFGADGSEKPASNKEGTGMTASEACRTASFKLLLAYALLLSMGMYAYSMLLSYIATLPEAHGAPMLGAMVSSVAMASQTVGKLAWGAAGEREPVCSSQ